MNRSDKKVICHTDNDFDSVCAHLKKHKAQFYTHERNSAQPHCVVLRGLPEVEPKLSNFDSRRTFNWTFWTCTLQTEEGVHRGGNSLHCSLSQGTHQPQEAECSEESGARHRPVDRNRNKHPNVTQCKNCLHLGHGAKNCYLKGRCNICKAEETQAKRSTNCSRAH